MDAFSLDRNHRVIDEFADRRLLGVGLKMRPAGLRRHPEHTVGSILVRVLRIGPLVHFGQQLGMLLGERIGDVFQEDQAEHDVLILSRVQVIAELVGAPAALVMPQSLSMVNYAIL